MTLKVKNVTIKRWWDGWIAAIAVAVIAMVAVRLWATEWTGDLYILVYVTFFAAVTGLSLGVSRFSPFVSALFSTVYGVFIIGWQFGTTIQGDISWRERLLFNLGGRLAFAIEQFLAGRTIMDPILFLTLMAVLLWILGSLSAFILIRRGTVWPVLIPLGITLMVIGHYDAVAARNTRFLMTFLFLGLLLVGRMTFLRYRDKWHREGIQTTTETHSDLNKTLLIVTVVLLVVAWVIPITPRQKTQYSALWENIKERWDNWTDQFSDILVVAPTPSPFSSANYGETLGLGRGTPSSEEPVFSINIETQAPPGYRYYWRARSYDSYDDAEWSTSPDLTRIPLFPANFDIPYPEWQPGEITRYTVTAQVGLTDHIFSAGLPVNLDRPAEAVTQTISETESDLVALIANPIVVSGDTYTVESQVVLPTETELRGTSTDYPLWVDRYLQLPEDFSPEIAALAQNIAGELDNPFDQAYAITRYLRINIEYSRTIPEIPQGFDPMEWFLFEGRTGFCNYYATAQVLMLRSLGIPARMAVGYAQGEFDTVTQTYLVQERNSHAWPEVYFVDYGWVTFEPTVSEPAYILPAGGPDENDEELRRDDLPMLDEPTPEPEESFPGEVIDSEADESFFQNRRSLTLWTILIVFLVVVLSAVAAFLWPSHWKIKTDPLPVLLEGFLVKRGMQVPDWLERWRYLATMSVPEKAYRQVGRSIKQLGQKLDPAHTPEERAQALTRLIPNALEPAMVIIREYHLDRFSDHMTNKERTAEAAQYIRYLTRQVRYQRIFGFLKKN
jgi:transglutaminase-like putative cysteine protease